MHPSLKSLLELQEIDGQMIFLKRAKESRPRELDPERKRLQDLRVQIEASTQEIKRLRMDADRRELDLKKNEAEILRQQTQLNQASSNQEYQVLKEQIARMRVDNGAIEEEVLTRMTESDACQGKKKQAEAEAKHFETDLKKKEVELQEVVKGLDGQIADLSGRRAEALRAVPADHLALYDRVLQRHRDFAIARVEHQICQGCFMSATPQTINILMQDRELIQCRNCLRILYLP